MKKSIWKDHAPETHFPSLDQDLDAEVAIVGGGITGITAAHLLSQSGKKVVLLEARKIGEGTTGDSTGNLYCMVDKRLHHIQSKWNQNTARIVAESRKAAVDLVEKLVNQYQIECDFKRVPWYLFSETTKKDKTIEKEKKAAQDYGLEVEELADLPLSIPVHSALRIGGQAQFNPAAFVKGLVRHIDPENCRIFENSPVLDIEKGSQPVLKTSRGRITASKVILATHTPKGVLGLHTLLYPYREYAIAARLASGAFPEGIFWDTEAMSHKSMRSFSTDSGKYVLVLGGHHKVGQEEEYEKYYQMLEESARKYFDVAAVEYRWSAQHYKPSDGLPFIGQSSEKNIFVATGFSTDGLTYGVLSAMILEDTLNNRSNPWAETYDPKRFNPTKSAKEFIKENLNVAGQYVKNIPGTSQPDPFSDLKSGQGKVVDHHREKWAVYKDEKGSLHCLSAVCPHMGCIVDWNEAEKSWDCPCHGSRFEPGGEVIEGPAFSSLEKKKWNTGEL